jgi:hypothetical protein
MVMLSQMQKRFNVASTRLSNLVKTKKLKEFKMKKIIMLIMIVTSLLFANGWQKYSETNKWTGEICSGIRFIDTSGVVIQIKNSSMLRKLQIKMPVRLKKTEGGDYFINCKVGQYYFKTEVLQDDYNDFLFLTIIDKEDAISLALASDISFSFRLVDEEGKVYVINIQ